MRVFAGLGNPGGRYAQNRHNIGFMALDVLADRHGFGPWRSRFQGLASEGNLAGGKVLLLKPQTFMNESGRSIAEAARFFKLPPAAIAVWHDELDLAPGKVRVKPGGGVAGHNGLRSAQACLGTPGFKRVRLGIGHPGDRERVLGYVLGDFSRNDREWLGPFLDALADAAPLLAADDDAGFMNKVALVAPAPRPDKREPA
ncbi:aminoacyl-tRNA hydrolase [Marinivivus vitaminiproducens]|uniref:aminoacyl-tRNA hydrolase n=1 Tax=Marinivivus vitaminiproducens TaxID=3035935 RepID=UPI0027A247F6|nr:aminoacyl-tRNA hydrolase [Geminicoccaceae bacterium SCSIO 64248]